MSELRLVIGRAGSGKTALIYREVLALAEQDPTGPPLWLIVPEQATFQAERDLSMLSRAGGLMRIRTSSFRRLGHHVSQVVGGATLSHISPIGRQMLVRQAVEENKGILRLFGRAARQPGFCVRLMELMAELKRYGVSPADCLKTLQQGEGMPVSLYNKLHDLSVVYESVEEKLQSLGVLDGEGAIDRLAEQVREYPELADSHVWFDGFTGFTPQESEVVGRMMAVTRKMTITLTMPAEAMATRLRDGDPFYTPWETAQKLLADANRFASHTSVTSLEGTPRFAGKKSLAYLEENYHSPAAEPFTEDVVGSIALVAATDRRVEVEAAAREIIRLCRDEGYRYRDVCIIVRDLTPYEGLLPIVLQDHDIPYFIDRKRSVPHHPLFDLLRASLEALQSNFAYDPVMRCLKTGLFPLSAHEVDALDNFVLAAGIRGKRWLSEDEWASQTDRYPIESIEKSRCVFAAFMRPLTDAFSSRQAGDMARGLLEYLVALDITGTLTAWSEEALAHGDPESAQVHAQVYAGATQLLRELGQAFGSDVLEIEALFQLVVAGLDGISLGLIPPRLDQVLVATLGRSRSPSVKAALVLGANEGVFPARARAEGIFSDDDRELLKDFNLLLGPTVRRQLFDEGLLVYTALTRADHYLYVSYAQATEDGGTLVPSSVVRRLQQLFPRLRSAHVSVELPADVADLSAYLSHPYGAAGMLATELRKQDGKGLPAHWLEVHAVLRRDTRFAPLVDLMSRGSRYNNVEAPLPVSLVRRMYGSTLRGSISRLEQFNNCPFAYFAAYGLKLKEREVYKLAAPDIGTFFHDALDLFAVKAAERKLDWGSMEEEQCEALAGEITAALVPKLQGEILLSSNRNRYMASRLEKTLARSAKVLGKHLSKGQFRPLAVEMSFGEPEGKAPALSFPLSDGGRMELSGRIDRIDGAYSGGRLYVRVIDYKSGDAKLTAIEAYHGLKIQLLIYLHAALKFAETLQNHLSDETIPAAALYFHVHDPIFSGHGPMPVADVIKENEKKFRPSGFVLAEDEVVSMMEEGLVGRSELMPIRLKTDGRIQPGRQAWTREQYEAMGRHLRESIACSAERIRGGDVDIVPARLDKYIACTYCRYRAVCGFDPGVPGNQYNNLEKLSLAGIWAKIGVTGEEDDNG